jgi:hypothetical protein
MSMRVRAFVEHREYRLYYSSYLWHNLFITVSGTSVCVCVCVCVCVLVCRLPTLLGYCWLE